MGVGAKSDSRSFVGHPDYELPFKRNYQPALIPHTEQMGVHGLTTFLRENRRALSKSETFSSASGSERDSYTPLVVDGWSLIYALYTDSGLPWVYGGEYEAFAKYVQDIAKAWLAVGLEPYFVFDGPTPLAKIPTTLKRLVDTNIHNANIFFRTSAAARSTPSFLASTRIIPPLLLETCLDALGELRASNSRVHTLMADGEADPFCVSLAGALGGGLVVGLDSDFSVLSAEGYGGYIPLDEMVWQSSPAADEASPNQAAEDDDGFTAVVTKPRTKRKSSGLIPPSGSDLSLNVTVYHPRTLAEHLRLPPALLPLFSALVGNDFSNPQNTKKFFENRSTPAERIWKVARSVVAATKKSQSGTQTPSHGRGDAVLDVIHSAVSQLLVRPDLIGSGEVDKIVDETIVAALECTIPALQRSYSPTDLCPLHPEDECPLISSLGENGTSLVKAYRAGRVHVRVLGAATTGIVLPKQFLEDPEQKACTAVTNNIWTWIWAILGAGGHVSASSPTEDNTTTGDDGTEIESRAEDDSELISVVDDFTATEPSVCSEDLASELKERLKGLAGSWDEDTEGIKSDKAPGKSLAQYVRRGLKLVPEPVTLQLMSELSTTRLPEDGAQYWIRHDRILAFLEGTKSNTQALQDAFKVSSVDPGVLLWVCALRCVVQSSAEGANGGSGSPAVVGRWKKNEARALLAALVNSDSSTSSDATPPLDTRTIQRIAQVLYAFDAGARLAEVVYLFEEKGEDGVEKLGGRDVVGRAVRLFSGRAVHAAASTLPEVDDHVWRLVCDGLEEDVWAYEPRAEKVKTKAKKKSKSKTDGNGNGAGRGHGFNLLASLGTE